MNNTYIFSASRIERTQEQNSRANEVVEQVLRSNGVKFKRVIGVYERNDELSYVVHGDHSIEALVRSLTAGYNQDCYLKVDGRKQAWFINPFGGDETYQGVFRSVGKLLTTCYPGFTFDPDTGVYYTIQHY